MIFERDVQESLPADTDANIPSHITTEDHIPPVLEASSHAIAENVDPDEVEIVTSSIHIPAASAAPPATSAARSPGASSAALPSSLSDSTVTSSALEGASASDVRRLSFISFADVVQAEHAEHHITAASEHSLRPSSPPLSSGQRTPGSPVGSLGTGGGEAVVESMTKALRSIEEDGAEGTGEKR